MASKDKARIETMRALAVVRDVDVQLERTIKGYIEMLEIEINNLKLQAADDTRIVCENYDAIWAAVGDGKGAWDYPAQIIRLAELLKQDRDTQMLHKVEFANKLNDLAFQVEMAKKQQETR